MSVREMAGAGGGREDAEPLTDPDRVRAAEELLAHLGARAGFDDLARLAARLLSARSAQVTVVSDRQVVVGGHGLPVGALREMAGLEGTISVLVARAGSTLVVPSARRDARIAGLPVVVSGLVRSFLGTPLVDSDGHVVGVLAVADVIRRSWSRHDADVLEQLAAAVVADLERSAVTAIASRALARLDLAMTAGKVGSWEIELDTETVELDERAGALLVGTGPARVPRTTLLQRVFPEDLEAVAAAMGTALATRGRFLCEYRVLVDPPPARPLGPAVRAVPDRVRWVLAQGQVVLHPASGEPVRVLGIVQDVTEAHREAAERIDALQRSASLAAVAASLAGVTTVQELCDVAVRGARVLGANSAALAGFEPDGDLLLHLSRQLQDRVAGQGVPLTPDGYPLLLDDRLPAQFTARTGEAVYLPDPATAEAWFPAMSPIVELTQVGALASLPLRVEGRRTGSLTVTWSAPRAFGADDVELLEALAAQLASAFSRLQADAARERAAAEIAAAAERLQLLAEAGRVLSGTLEVTEQVGQLASLLVPSLADWCWVVVTDGSGRMHALASAHRDPARDAELARAVRAMVASRSEAAGARVVTRTGRPLVLPTVVREPDDRSTPDPAGRGWPTPHSGVVVPLPARGEVLGALGLFQGADRPPHTTDELETAAEIGRRAGLALFHARRFDQQRQLAEALQRSMLTAPPTTGAARIEVRYVPAASGAEIGGDWYDAFLDPAGTTVFAIGDVVGHDNRAAASMGQLRGMLRGIAYTGGGTPAEVLTALDRAVLGLDLPAMATALVARLEQDGGGRLLRWASAGHPVPVRLRADGSVQALDGGPVRMLLGVDAGTTRHDTVTALAPGDTVVLYTDGLVERRDRDLDQGAEQLHRALAELAGLPLDELCDRLLERMFLPDAEDDVALLVLRVPGPEDPGA